MKVRKGLSNFILLTLEKSVDGLVRINDLLNHSGYYAYGGGWDYPLNKSALSQALKRLREGELRVKIQLTEHFNALNTLSKSRDGP